MTKKKFFLIDGHAQLFQAFYAIPELKSPAGEVVNAVYGFTAMLRKLIKKQNPYYLAIAFDTKGPTFRHNIFKDYKANRKTMPDNLQPQIPLLKSVISAYKIPMFSLAGYEADDIMGTIAKKLSEQGIETILITKDKDLEQLISDNVKFFDIKKGEFYDLEMFEAKREIKPVQMIEILALTGDTSDNIPGVPGIGNKTATKLIKEWASLEGILENIDKISARRTKESLIQFAEQARLSRRLATIDTEVPIDFNLEKCRMDGVNEQEINNLFQEFGFKSFLR